MSTQEPFADPRSQSLLLKTHSGTAPSKPRNRKLRVDNLPILQCISHPFRPADIPDDLNYSIRIGESHHLKSFSNLFCSCRDSYECKKTLAIRHSVRLQVAPRCSIEDSLQPIELLLWRVVDMVSTASYISLGGIQIRMRSWSAKARVSATFDVWWGDGHTELSRSGSILASSSLDLESLRFVVHPF